MVLAVLLSRANHIVPQGALIEAGWVGNAVGNSVSPLQVQVRRRSGGDRWRSGLLKSLAGWVWARLYEVADGGPAAVFSFTVKEPCHCA